ncbi:MAG TPA: hypothetical protein VKF59_19690 [Candidatus Dormibacteraeota bacterium]|nr:hypothetical protein [Candidatus Dormibacteraeota bacterium]
MNPLDLLDPLRPLRSVARPPGDPGAIRSGAHSLVAAGEALAGQARELRELTAGLVRKGVWSSPGALAFELAAGEVAAELDRSAGRYRKAAEALMDYARVLDEAQAQSGAAQGRLDRLAGDLRALPERPADALAQAARDLQRGHAEGEAAVEAARAAARRAAEELDRLAAGVPPPASLGGPGGPRGPGRPPLPPWVRPQGGEPTPQEFLDWLREQYGLVPVWGPGGRLQLHAAGAAGTGRSPSGGAVLAGAALVAALLLLWAVTQGPGGGGPRGGSVDEAKRTYEGWRRDLERQMKHFGIVDVAAPPPPPPPGDEQRAQYDRTLQQARLRDEARRDAQRLGVDPERYERLAFDPDIGEMTTGSVRDEAPAAIQAERQGLVTTLERPAVPGQGDFIETAKGVRWDVKTPGAGSSMSRIAQAAFPDISQGENVIFNTKNLSPQEVATLQREVATRGWSSRVIYVSA